MAKKKKYYVVWEGNTPGVYDSWADCQLQIKGYPNARYKSFSSKAEAAAAYTGNFTDYIQSGSPSAPKKPKVLDPEEAKNIIWDSIAVDAACSGNPGVMEYQGVDTQTSDQLFHQKFNLGTNNIGEFLALVHGLAVLQQQDLPLKPIYTDSKIAMNWVRLKKCKTNLKRTPSTAKLYAVIQRAEQWLKNNTYTNPILKWETDKWGEIPADFGRK